MEHSENEPITRRLHSLGEQPIDPGVAARHRNLMASVAVGAGRSRLRPLMVGSLLAGSLMGGMGLAAAAPGVPDSASDVAKTVLATVTLGAVDEPEDEKKSATAVAAKEAAKAAKTERAAAKAHTHATKSHATKTHATKTHATKTHGVTRSTAGCPAGFTGNHGAYVSSVAKDPNATEAMKQAAAESECGKPVHAPKPAGGDDAKKPDTAGRPENNPGKGSGKPEVGGEQGRSNEDHPGERPNQKASDAGAEHRKAGAGASAGHGPVTTTTTAG